MLLSVSSLIVPLDCHLTQALREMLLTDAHGKKLPLKTAIQHRDSVCTHMYRSLFAHIVSVCNEATGPVLDGGAPEDTGTSPALRIDVVDCPGHSSGVQPGGLGMLLSNTIAEWMSSMFRCGGCQKLACCPALLELCCVAPAMFAPASNICVPGQLSCSSISMIVLRRAWLSLTLAYLTMNPA